MHGALFDFFTAFGFFKKMHLIMSENNKIYDPLEENKDKNSLIKNIVTTAYIGGIMAVLAQLFPILKEYSKASDGYIMKQLGVLLILTIISSHAILYFHRFVSLIRDTKRGEFLSGFLVVSLFALLFAGLYFPLYVLVGIGLFIITVKVYQLRDLLVKKNNVGVYTAAYLNKLLIGYLVISLIVLIISSYLDISKFQIIPPYQDGELFVLLRSKVGSLSIANSDAKAILTLLSKQQEELSNLRHMNALVISSTVYILVLVILLSMYKGLLYHSVQMPKILDELRYYYANIPFEGDDNKKGGGGGNIKSILPLLIIMRPFVSAVAGAVAAATYYYVEDIPSSNIIISIFLVVLLTSSAGFIINDCFDMEKDGYRSDKDKRVLPSGQLKRTVAVVFAVFLVLFSLILSVFINSHVFCLNLFTIFLLSIYSWINNKYGVLANIVTAINTSFVLIIGMLAGEINTNVIILAACVFFFIAGREIILDIRDIDSDRVIGKTSLPLRYGENISDIVSGILFLLVSAIALVLCLYFNNIIYFISVGLFFNLILWSSYIAYLRQRDFHSIDRFILMTRLSFIFIIPPLIF